MTMDSPALQALLHNWFYGNLFVRESAAIVFAALFASIPVTPTFQWVFGDLDPRIARTSAALAPVANTIKGFIAVAISAHGGGLGVGLLAAVAAMAGHCYCPWRKFSGGTGVAVELGVLIGVCPPAAIIYLAIWLVTATASNYAMVGSLLASAFSVISLWYFLGAPGAFAGVAMFLIVAGRYRGSFERLSEDREPTLRRPPRLSIPLPAPARRPASIVIMDRQTV